MAVDRRLVPNALCSRLLALHVATLQHDEDPGAGGVTRRGPDRGAGGQAPDDGGARGGTSRDPPLAPGPRSAGADRARPRIGQRKVLEQGGRDLVVRATWVLIAMLQAAGSTPAGAFESEQAELTSIRDLVRYVGTYPCSNGLLETRALLKALRSVLGPDYVAYRDHLSLSGCGAIERRDGFLLMDVSQLHVGGYSSLLFVNPSDGALYLFWLNASVAEKQWRIYGPRPVPEAVMQAIEADMNESWGHVARFRARGETLEIELRD